MGNSYGPRYVERVTDAVSTSFSFMSVILNLINRAESGDYKLYFSSEAYEEKKEE